MGTVAGGCGRDGRSSRFGRRRDRLGSRKFAVHRLPQSGQITGVTIAPATPTVCVKPAVRITWSQTGPQGTSVQSTQLPVGNAHCSNGGSSFAVGTVTTYACNGTDGTNGTNGTNGARRTGRTAPTGPTAPTVGVSVTLRDGTARGECANGGTKFTAAKQQRHLRLQRRKRGRNGTIAAQSCDPGISVTGIDGSGNLICSCPHDCSDVGHSRHHCPRGRRCARHHRSGPR